MQAFEFNTFAVFPELLQLDKFGVNVQKVLYFLACVEKKEFATFNNITTVLKIPVATAKRVFKELKDSGAVLLDNKTYSYRINKNILWPNSLEFALKEKQYKGGGLTLKATKTVQKLQDIEFIFLNTKVAKEQDLDENIYLLCEVFFRLGRLGWGVDNSAKKLFIRATKKELAEFLGFSQKTIYTYNQKILEKYGLDYINDPSTGFKFGDVWANLHGREDCLTYAKNLNKY